MQTKLKVILVNYTPKPEETIYSSAKVCYSKVGIEDVIQIPEDWNYKAFLDEIISAGHLSPVEHVSFTFAIEGISRVCSHQLVRHRLASYSQQSQRYVDEKEFEYIIPKSIEKNEQLKNKFEDLMLQIQNSYMEFVDTLKHSGYTTEHAREDSRFLLPNATETKIVVTMNGRELLYFFRLRLCNRAQWEIRELATKMLELVKPIAPVIFQKAGPPCLNGKCTEGTKSCGRTEQIREKFKSIN